MSSVLKFVNRQFYRFFKIIFHGQNHTKSFRSFFVSTNFFNVSQNGIFYLDFFYLRQEFRLRKVRKSGLVRRYNLTHDQKVVGSNLIH